MFWSLITVSFSASNYIISGSSGFETAKACAVIEETPRSNENQISIDDNYDLPVSVKPGKGFYQFDLRLNSKQLYRYISATRSRLLLMNLKYFQFSIISKKNWRLWTEIFNLVYDCPEVVFYFGRSELEEYDEDCFTEPDIRDLQNTFWYIFCISHLILFIIFVAFDANISIAKFNKVFLIKTNPISGTFNLNFKVDDQRLN